MPLCEWSLARVCNECPCCVGCSEMFVLGMHEPSITLKDHDIVCVLTACSNLPGHSLWWHDLLLGGFFLASPHRLPRLPGFGVRGVEPNGMILSALASGNWARALSSEWSIDSASSVFVCSGALSSCVQAAQWRNALEANVQKTKCDLLSGAVAISCLITCFLM